MGKILFGHFGRPPVAIPESAFELAEKWNLKVVPVGNEGSYMIEGQEFTTDAGVKIKRSYGYLRPTGRQRYREDGKEEIEVYCCRRDKAEFVSVSALEPFPFLYELD